MSVSLRRWHMPRNPVALDALALYIGFGFFLMRSLS